MSENPSTVAARALVEALIAQGVRHVVISPGSRSAPIVYALERSGLDVHVRIDERVAAFTALGFARFGPAAVVTTSGTAAANLHPALLEARHSHLGLIAITADRPHEMRGVAANQTTEQTHMYGPHIHAVEIPAGAQPAGIGNQIARVAAVARGVFTAPAPVHVNIAFREPLVPEQPEWVPGVIGPEVYPRRLQGESVPINTTCAVVVAGDGAGEQAARFAAEAELPLLAEPSSGARGGATAVGPYQRLLPELLGEIRHAIVFGRPTLSRPVSALLAEAPEVTVVDSTGQWVDVAGNATRVVAGVEGAPCDTAWLARWREAEAALTLDGGRAAEVVARVLAGDVQVMLGSSMAIRYADIFGPVGEDFTNAPVWACRGLAGIDGTVSTASGIALGSDPVRVVVGDLTFAHDVGALALGPEERTPDIQIVVLNDRGGGIFAHLEHGQPEYASTFPRFFATPVDIEIGGIAQGYGLEHRLIAPGESLEVLDAPVRGRSIVEIQLPSVAENF